MAEKIPQKVREPETRIAPVPEPDEFYYDGPYIVAA
jgi:hypothetical protein